MKVDGIMTALVTPIRHGEVDDESLERLIEFQIKNKVDSLLVLGGTGEYVGLSSEQRKHVIDFTVEKVGGRLPVVVGIIAPGIGDALEIGRYAKEIGADALMPVTPYYVGPTQKGIINYYKALDELGLPIFLYNIPHKTGVNMKPETVAEIIEQTKHVVGIKECTTDFGQMIELINKVGDRITVLAGEEFSAVATMIFGASGAVMASANIIPDYWVKMYKLIIQGEREKAIQLNSKNIDFYKVIFAEPNPGPLKAYMVKKGVIRYKDVVTPLKEASATVSDKLNQIKGLKNQQV